MTASPGLPRRGLYAVLGLPWVVSGPVQVQGNPDAALERICAEHVVNLRRYNAEGGRLPFGEFDPLQAAMLETSRAVDKAKPQTMAGVMAKVRVIMAEAEDPDGDIALHGTVGEIWALDVLNDLLRLYGGAA